MKKLVILSLLLVLLPSVFAIQEMSNPFRQGTCIDLVQSCDDCTYVNFTSVTYPDGDYEILNAAGEKHATDFNYTFCDTNQVGTYIIRTVGDLGGEQTFSGFNIYINPSGMTFNNIIYEYLFFALIFLTFYAILYFGFKKEDLTIVMLPCFGILFLAVYIIRFGIANLNNDYTMAFSIINIGISGYLLVRSSISLVEMNGG